MRQETEQGDLMSKSALVQGAVVFLTLKEHLLLQTSCICQLPHNLQNLLC